MTIDEIFDRSMPMPESGCWIWQGSVAPNGYGKVGKGYLVHRVAYEAAVGPIPAGLDIDHLCRVRCCCNPAHLEPVTRRENMLRSPIRPRFGVRKSHCPQGHAYEGANVYFRKDGGRDCMACRRMRNGGWRATRI